MLSPASRSTRVLTCAPSPFCPLQLWLDNQSTVAAVSSVYARVLAAASGLRNAFFGQTRSRARLNAIASYDQSNELFKVRPRARACMLVSGDLPISMRTL